jgi:phosphate ABC transporter phosphate-binding protein
MTGHRTTTRRRRWSALAAVSLAILVGSPLTAAPAAAAQYVPISGAGSTWSFNAIDAWRKNVVQYGMTINYAAVGSTTGRSDFKQGSVQWAASDIPYGVKDGNNFDPPPTRGYAYLPDTAGGTTFMYNLTIGTHRVTNLRLSGAVISGIFTGTITQWNDPKIAADNPGLTLPGIKIVPVVRSDGSGATAQFTQWMIATNGSYWNAYCAKVGRDPCTQTSAYPVLPGSGMIAQSGDLGVSGYVSQQQADGAIGYVEYSYALETGFPVAKVLNAAGYYTEPTPGHVAVSLLQAQINMNPSDPLYLTQNLSKVYTDADPRTYPLSSYSYLIIPTDSAFGLTNDQGYTIAAYGGYLLCQGQSQVDALGYSALPINLVQDGFDQLKKIPGANLGNLVISKCDNPTFSTNGTNTLATTDPYPPACDKQGSSQCANGTGGAQNTSTPEKAGATGNSASGGSTSAVLGGAGGGGANSTTAAGASGTGSGAAACDPDSGHCTSSGASGQTAGDASAVPQSLQASLGDGWQVAFMVLAGAILLCVCLIPPVIAQVAARRKARSGR